MRKIRVFVEATIQLASPDDYPEEVSSWQEAAQWEVERMGVTHSEGVDVGLPSFSFDCLFEPDDPFVRVCGSEP